MKDALFLGLALLAIGYVVIWGRAIARARRDAGSPAPRVLPSWPQAALGFGTNFFDTLGIGNFAPTAAVFRLTRSVPDGLIPGTMNVGHTLPVVLMAFLFISIVEVEPTTLLTLIGAAVVGAWFGAGVVARLPQRPVQLGMGAALLVAALLMVLGQIDAMPMGGDALGLSPGALTLAAVGSAALGALNTIGVGLYAPCMIMIALLGMDPKAAFPIMMGSCAFLMPVGSARFVLRGVYSPRAALGLTLGGLPAVPIAAFLIRSLPLDMLRWLVVGVATYTALLLLRPPAARMQPIAGRAGTRARTSDLSSIHGGSGRAPRTPS